MIHAERKIMIPPIDEKNTGDMMADMDYIKASTNLENVIAKREESYHHHELISHIGKECNPDKECISTIIKDLLKIIFPGLWTTNPWRCR
jgi:hypothetical protein